MIVEMPNIAVCPLCGMSASKSYYSIFEELCCYDCMVRQNQKFLNDAYSGEWVQRQKGWRVFSSTSSKPK